MRAAPTRRNAGRRCDADSALLHLARECSGEVADLLLAVRGAGARLSEADQEVGVAVAVAVELQAYRGDVAAVGDDGGSGLGVAGFFM